MKKVKTLSRAEQAFKAYLGEKSIQPFSAVTPEEVARETALFNEWAGECALPFEEHFIKVRDGFAVRTRVFNARAKGTTFFFLPGNGYCVAHIFDANTVAASRIAKASACCVILIDFRLMPAAPWPMPVEDATDVINACLADHPRFGIDPNQIALGGLSGGAHASVLIALDQNRGFDIQKLLLVNGPFDFTFSQNHFAEDEALDYICARKNLFPLQAYWGLADKDLTQPEYSPLFATSFANFPETFIIVGEFDGIRSDSEALYERLLKEHVKVSKIVLLGQTHNNILFYKTCGDDNDAAVVCAKVLA